MSDNENQNGQIKRFELFLTLFGAIVTALLGYGQYQLSRTQTQLASIHAELAKQQQNFQQQLADQQNVLQVLSVVKDYLPLIDEDSPKGKKAVIIISAAANQMSVKYNNQFLADLAKAILEAPKSYDAATLQISEATIPVTPSSNAKYFAVLASYSITQLDRAKNAAYALAESQKEYRVGIYKTKTSNNYALTIGDQLAKADAIRLVQKARNEGWSEDAFAQIDRDWEKIQ